MKLRKFLFLFAALAVSATASAQGYPNKPVQMIVPFPPGGGGDALARAFVDVLGPRLGQPIIIDNKPGADQVIATTALARARPDGYTLMLTGSNAMLTHMASGRKLPYEPLVDVVPIGKVAVSPLVLIANSSLGVKDLKGLVAKARANPKPLNAAHIGVGAIHYLNLKLLEEQLGLSFLTVPYKGSGPAATAVASGEVDVTFTGPENANRLGQSGRTVALGITGSSRSPAVPALATLAEQGVPDMLNATFYIYVPRSTPAPVIERLLRETRTALADGQLVQRLSGLGFNVEAPGTVATSMTEHKAGVESIRRLIKDLPQGLTE